MTLPPKLQETICEQAKCFGAGEIAYKEGADSLYSILEPVLREVEAVSKYYTRKEVEERFQDCWDNGWKLTPSKQYSMLYLLNERGDIIFSFSRLINALDRLRETIGPIQKQEE